MVQQSSNGAVDACNIYLEASKLFRSLVLVRDTEGKITRKFYRRDTLCSS